MIGRKKECSLLKKYSESNRPEFLVIYGRRRVGKTYLVKEFFNYRFSFYATGLANTNMKNQLRAFNDSLKEYGCTLSSKAPSDWYEAFSRLKSLLLSDNIKKDPVSGKKVVFLDELPWMDTARSDFKSALEYFWNSWASEQKDLLLIVCGSATSWIMDNIIGDKGGFYNRITGSILLRPFTLKECEEYYKANDIVMTRQQVIESYMIFGGIPYYLNYIDRRMSLSQNVDELCFKDNGQLHYEYRLLFSSLFKNADMHMKIIESISRRKSGILRAELASIKEIGDGAPLTKALKELEQCGFIRKYKNYKKEKSGYFYQLIDPFTLFCLDYIENSKVTSWMTYINSPGYYAWCGNAFEMVCLLHTEQIKTALGVQGVDTTEYSWRSSTSSPGAQIDLMIDRKDGIINLCEMKFTNSPFTIDSSYAKQLENKISTFVKETSTKKAIHLTMISANGIVSNEYINIVQNSLTVDDLF